MFDYFYARYGLGKEPPLDLKYKTEDSIAGKSLSNKGADKLAVIFPGWHNRPDQFPVNRLVKRLNKKGWSVLAYDFDDQILEPDDEQVVKSFKYIRDQVCKDLTELSKDYEQISLVGFSLGSVPWAFVTDSFTKFTSATVIVGGDDLAIDMWYGMRTQHYRKAFEKMHVGIRKLDKDWLGLATINHLKNFKGKPVKVVVSLNDDFIGTKHQKRLVERLLDNGAIVKVKKSHLGHALTIMRFCVFGNIV